MAPPRNLPREDNQNVDKAVCTKMFMTALFITEKKKSKLTKEQPQDRLLG